jgi:hypothetical protein
MYYRRLAARAVGVVGGEQAAELAELLLFFLLPEFPIFNPGYLELWALIASKP